MGEQGVQPGRDVRPGRKKGVFMRTEILKNTGKHTASRVLSMVLAVMLVLSLAPISAFAQEWKAYPSTGQGGLMQPGTTRQGNVDIMCVK